MARTEWGMTAKYLFTELPEWELDVLLAERVRARREAEKQQQGG